MAQTIYGLVWDGSDGSASIFWFKNAELVEALTNSLMDTWDESFNLNEQGPEILTFPDSVDLEACGFRFSDADYNLSISPSP